MTRETSPVLINFYNDLLSHLKLSVADEDSIIESRDGELPEFTDKDKYTYVLPFNRNLKNPGNNRIFHPLNESYINPDRSPCLNAIRNRLVVQLNLDLSALIIAIINVSLSSEASSKISRASLIELFGDFKALDSKFIDTATQIIKEGSSEKLGKHILDIYIRKNGEIDDVDYTATGKVLFPLRDELADSEDMPSSDIRVYGVKCRRSDVSNLLAIIDYIFPSIEATDSYSDGSKSTTFRYFDTLLRLSFILTQQINRVCKEFKSIKIKETKSLFSVISYDRTVFDHLVNLYDATDEIRDIPNQDNVGGEDPPQVSKLDIEAKNQRPPPDTRNHEHSSYPTPPPQQHHNTQQHPNHQHVNHPPNTQDDDDPIKALRGDGVNYNQSYQYPSHQGNPMQMGQQPMQMGQMYPGMTPNQPMQPMGGQYPGYHSQGGGWLPSWAQQELVHNQQVNQYGQPVDQYGRPLNQNQYLQPRSTFA